MESRSSILGLVQFVGDQENYAESEKSGQQHMNSLVKSLEPHLNQMIPNLSGFDAISILWLLVDDEITMNGDSLDALVFVGNKPYAHGIVFGVDGGLEQDFTVGGVEDMDDGVLDYAHGLGMGVST